MVTLRQPLTLAECQQVRIWRNDPAVLPMLRTGYKTEEEQEQFYRDVICNPKAPHWYYAIEADGQFIGMGGLTYVKRWKRCAEISLILGPDYRGNGYGREAVAALLEEAANRRLRWVEGECYADSPALGFWTKVIADSAEYAEIANKSGSLRWRWA